jgi:hypothetical protein
VTLLALSGCKGGGAPSSAASDHVGAPLADGSGADDAPRESPDSQTGNDVGIDVGSDLSPGTVTLRLRLAAGVSYCDQGTYCGGTSHISIRTAAGAPLNTVQSFIDCPTACDTCQRPPCPGIACIEQGIPVKDEERTWDGRYWELSSCGSPSTQCLRPRFAPRGRYIAHMCATPGILQTADGGRTFCTKTADTECIEVAFDLPSSAAVEGKLLGPGAKDR